MSAKRLLAWSTAAVSACGAAGLAYVVHTALPADGRPAPGVFIGARIPPSDPTLGAWLERRRQALSTQRVLLLRGLDAHEMTLGELGVELDVEKTMDNALRPGREGTWRQRAKALRLARDGFIDVPLAYTVDLRRAAAGLESIRGAVRRPPVNAHLNLTAHERIADVPGEELDVQATMADVMKGVNEGIDAFEVATKLLPAQVSLSDLDAVDVTKEAASFETKFALWGVGRNRGTNIALAAKTIDGMVLMPGQSFSFNEVVGRRTLERGYVWAPVIVGDELRPGVGGGICQVASTLYASALYGAMQITERWAHGRPSSYTRLGLDATVSYPSKDLRFVNSLPYPVILHVFLPKSGVVRAEVLGGEPVAKVEYRYGVARTEEFVRRIMVKSWFEQGRVVRKQKGIRGFSVVSMVETDFGDGRVDKRSYYSEYRPTPEIFWVGPGTDEQKLPDLPPGAKGLENKLTESGHDDNPTG